MLNVTGGLTMADVEVSEIKNALIENTMLGIEDHGIMSFWLYLDYGGSGQGVGGYALDDFKEDLNRRIGTAEGMELIGRILRVVGVSKWEDLKGQHIRVKTGGWSGPVKVIGHFMKDNWLNFEEFFKNPFTKLKN
jgi:hypothetical protein